MNFIAALIAIRSHFWLGLTLSVLLPLAAMAARIAIGSSLQGYPYITFFPAVFLTAVLAGRVATSIAILISVLLAQRFTGSGLDSTNWIWVPPQLSDWIGVGLFIAVCATVAILTNVLSQTLSKLAAQTAELARANADLEDRVSKRTRELEDLNTKLRGEIQGREVAETKARQAQKMEAVGQLTGGIAHDFNNMLAIVIGSLDLASRRMARGERDIVKYLDNALDGARRGAALTQRLLAFSRQQPLQSVVADLNTVVQGIEGLLIRTLGETVNYEFALAGGLWKTKVDVSQLENAILNLAVNARDAMPAGGRLTVETANTVLDDDYARNHAEVSPGQYVMVAVSDTGDGMPQEILDRAFDPFFTTKSIGEGTGLGLSQVYGFVKQSGGHVKIYSELGQGTAVKIYLRREHVKAVNGEKLRDKEESITPSGALHELVVVVEDEPAVREMSVIALRELGYSVRHAASGSEALELLDTLPQVSLLLTDVVMPGMTGRQLVESATMRRPDIKVLYTTGYAPNAIFHNGVIDPGAELLSKPFTIGQLARKVRKILG